MGKIVLVRTPGELVKLNQIGYGWGGVNFSEFKSAQNLVDALKVKYGGLGRMTKQVERYFNLTEGDLVVVPLSGGVAIAEVVGNKSYVRLGLPNWVEYGENRIDVKYLCSKDGGISLPRKSLSTALQARLKIRMSITKLDEFSDEINKLINGLDSGELNTISKEVAEKIESEGQKFKSELLRRLQTNLKIGIQAGGYGLEKLIKELLEIEGYEANIQAKNQSNGIDDIDIKAIKQNSITGTEEILLIQVKHHNWVTGAHGIKQLIAAKEEGIKILITTASINEDAQLLAEKEGVSVMKGEELVNWVFDCIDQLRVKTREQLGIAIVPVLIGEY